MTWLGKILTFLVLIGAGAWAYFTIQSYVTRTNWKAELERERTARKASDAALVAELRRSQASEDTLRRLLVSERKKSSDLDLQVKAFSDSAGKTAEELKKLQKDMTDFDAKQAERQAKLDRTIKELEAVRDRNNVLENQMVALVVETEKSKKEAVKSLNEAKLALAIADDNAKKVEELIAKVTELKAIAAAGTGPGSLLKQIDKPPPAVLANLRGEVTQVQGNLVTLSIGIDAGLGVGSVLDIYRLDGGGRYLGTVKVTSALNLFPKQAIATFIPAKNVPLERLRVEDLPRKGDEVRPPNALTGGGQ
jgi:hypothetical protein